MRPARIIGIAILATTAFGAVAGIASTVQRPVVGSGYGIDEATPRLSEATIPSEGYGVTPAPHKTDRL